MFQQQKKKHNKIKYKKKKKENFITRHDNQIKSFLYGRCRLITRIILFLSFHKVEKILSLF